MTGVVLGCGESNGVVAHTVCAIDPNDPSKILILVAFEDIQAAPHISCTNECAPENIASMFSTLDTSHFDRSWLNTAAL